MSLDRLFHADSVAVIGASLNETKRGFQAIKTLIDCKYEGQIYPVNPKLDKVLGYKCYKSISKIPETVDIALITTPADTVPDIIKECGKKNIAGAVVVAGGFGELGEKGLELETKIALYAQKYNVRVIGPNTSGMINTGSNLNLVGLTQVPKGKIALITQSGNIALHLITEARLKSHSGFSYYVGVGNETDLKFHEYLEYFKNDNDTNAVLMYIEGLKDGRKFLQQVYKTTREKPIILLKSGRSSSGQKSAGSHTGAIAGISEVARSSFVRAGIINIENPDELFPAAEALSSLPYIRNNKVAILADGGGHATISADLLSDHGVEIPELSMKTKEKLREILPHNASVENPVDVAGGTDSDPEVFAKCAKILLKDYNIGGLLITGLFGGYSIRFSESLKFMEEDAAHQMGKMVKKTNKPIILQSLYNAVKPHSLELLRYYGIPVYDSIDISCKCISVLADYGKYLRSYEKKTNFIFKWRQKARKNCDAIISWARYEDRTILLEHEAKEIIKTHGAPTSHDSLAQTADEAVEIARSIPGKKVLKIVSPEITHKSDAGGVKLNLETDEDIRKAFNDIIESSRKYDSNADIKGCLVSQMKNGGVEVIIGTKIDQQFGPVIMFGIGGILVEVVKDVAFRVLPISKTSANEMIKEIKSSPILDGYRGNPPLDKQAITTLLSTVSEVIESYPDIKEMDLNPVIVRENGIDIVDARIILKDKNEVHTMY